MLLTLRFGSGVNGDEVENEFAGDRLFYDSFQLQQKKAGSDE